MTKILTDVPCTNCGNNHQAVIDLDEITKRIQEKPGKEVVKEVVKMPSWQPKEFCADGRCISKHENPNYKTRVTKRCANGDCAQFAPSGAKTCAWCGSEGLEAEDRWEELDEEELDLIGIPKPNGHEGHNHD